MAYHDGTTAAAVLDDLIMFEPTFYWAAWEDPPATGTGSSGGLGPPRVAYEAGTEDGYTSTGSGDGLFNEVHVRWEAHNTRVYTNTSTQTVPELDDAGLTRSAILDLD